MRTIICALSIVCCLPLTAQQREWENNHVLQVNREPARAYFIRPDGNTVDVQGSIADNVVSVELDEHVYTYIGRASGALVIENSTHSITIDAMKLNILKRNTDIITPDDDNFVIIGSGTLDTDAQTVVGAINELNSEIGGVEAISNAEIDALFT